MADLAGFLSDSDDDDSDIEQQTNQQSETTNGASDDTADESGTEERTDNVFHSFASEMVSSDKRKLPISGPDKLIILKGPKPKDPLAPKRPERAFYLFRDDFRKRVERENPSASWEDIRTVCASRWKAFTTEKQAPYIAEAAVQMVQWKAKMITYKETASYTEHQKKVKEWAKQRKKKKEVSEWVDNLKVDNKDKKKKGKKGGRTRKEGKNTERVKVDLSNNAKKRNEETKKRGLKRKADKADNRAGTSESRSLALFLKKAKRHKRNNVKETIFQHTNWYSLS